MTTTVDARPYTPGWYAQLAAPALDPRIPRLGTPHLADFQVHAGIPVVALGRDDDLLMAPGHHPLDDAAQAFDAHIDLDRWSWLGGDIADGTIRHAYAALTAPQAGEPWAVDTRVALTTFGAFPVTLWTPDPKDA